MEAKINKITKEYTALQKRLTAEGWTSIKPEHFITLEIYEPRSGTSSRAWTGNLFAPITDMYTHGIQEGDWQLALHKANRYLKILAEHGHYGDAKLSLILNSAFNCRSGVEKQTKLLKHHFNTRFRMAYHG